MSESMAELLIERVPNDPELRNTLAALMDAWMSAPSRTRDEASASLAVSLGHLTAVLTNKMGLIEEGALARERTLADKLAEALRLTHEYIGPAQLPAIAGWSWFDALEAYREARA